MGNPKVKKPRGEADRRAGWRGRSSTYLGRLGWDIVWTEKVDSDEEPDLKDQDEAALDKGLVDENIDETGPSLRAENSSFEVRSTEPTGSSPAREVRSPKLAITDAAIEAYLAEAALTEIPPAALCLKLARCYQQLGNGGEAFRWALAVVDAGDDFMPWQSAAALAKKLGGPDGRNKLQSARLALLGSYTTSQFAPLLWLAALRLGVSLEIYESPYGQYRQEILDPGSGMHSFDPRYVLLAVHEGELALPEHSESPSEEIEREVHRWTALWGAVAHRSAARVIQHNFAILGNEPISHLAARLPGSRYMMTRMVNARLGEEASDLAAVVDCEWLSGVFGKQRWFDARYWHLSKQAVALSALPLLARHNASVIAAESGLSRKCIVLDLDNTLWGGVIGEDGLAGIRLGTGVEGEAFVAFQKSLLQLKNRGVILTVCSKNNESDAREPFQKHPEMVLKLEDIALFVANWESKPDGIRKIAKELNIGLDSLVFVDDNPAERQIVRQLLPEVDVIPLPADPAQYATALSQYLSFESASFTPDDSRRTEQYKARGRIAELESATGTMEDFYRGLQMKAVIAPFDEVNLPRVAQLVGKTNQFNLTTRRHSLSQLRAFANDPNCVHLYLRLRDRFADHGLVGVLLAFGRGDVLEIDTWLLSCRVIGRTAEAAMLRQLCIQAEKRGWTSIRGTYIPTAKNAPVKDLFAKFGFELIDEIDGATTWTYDLSAKGPIANEFIETEDPRETNFDTTRAT